MCISQHYQQARLPKKWQPDLFHSVLSTMKRLLGGMLLASGALKYTVATKPHFLSGHLPFAPFVPQA